MNGVSERIFPALFAILIFSSVAACRLVMPQQGDEFAKSVLATARHCAQAHWAGEVRNVSLLVAIGVNHEGYREILGICEGAKEVKAGWSSFLKHPKVSTTVWN